MKYDEPWQTKIGRVNIAHLINMPMLQDEVFTLSMMTDNEDSAQVTLTKELFPAIIGVRNEIITPQVQKYAMEVWGYEIPELDMETNAKWIKQGEGLYPHYHPGSCISAIFYPTDSKSGLNMFDPRVNACRGYPKEIRNNFMTTYQLSPEAGDLVIFPSYVQHSVSHVEEEVRLSLLTEYYLRKNL